jgi:cell division transport system permease protein
MSYAPAPIISREAAPLKTLTVAMTVMCYLACLAIGALIIIDRAVDQWTGGLEREVTVQIRQLSTTDIDEEIDKAEKLLAGTRGVTAVNTMSRSKAADLLEPWLGAIKNIDELPVPRLIEITVDRRAPPDFTVLAAALKKNVKGASLDTHQHWQAELTRMAAVLQRLALAVLSLICVSAVAIVIFATRSVLDSNKGIVDVLHLVGARDGFIARQVEGRFLKSGLAAGLLGMGLGIATFLLMGLVGPSNAVADASRSLLFAPVNTAWKSYGLLLAVPVVAVTIGLLTSRFTLIRMLRASA